MQGHDNNDNKSSFYELEICKKLIKYEKYIILINNIQKYMILNSATFRRTLQKVMQILNAITFSANKQYFHL